MNTLHFAAASVLPRVFTLQPQDIKSEVRFAKALGVTKRYADRLVRELTQTQVLARAFDGLHFAVEVVELHRHLPERSGSCTLGHSFTTIQLPGEVSIRCERIWRQDVDPKQIKGLRKILKVYAKDRVKPKSVEIAKDLRQEDVEALEKAYTAAVRGIDPLYRVGGGHRAHLREALPKLLARRINPKDFRAYAVFVFETFQRITGFVFAPPRTLGSDFYIDSFKQEQGVVETIDYANARKLLLERGYKGHIDRVFHIVEGLLAGSQGLLVHAPPDVKEAAVWLYENMELVGTRETK